MVAALATVTAVALALDATVGLPGGVLHGRLLDGAAPSSSPSATAVAAVAPETATAVLDPAAGTTAPSPAALTELLTPLLTDPALGAGVGAVVVDVATGTQLYGRSATAGRTPASAAKLLTSTAALELLGPSARLRTTVVQTPAATGATSGTVPEIVIVGGGDPSLRLAPGGGDPSLRLLAQRTAAKLKASGSSKVRLRYDASLFAPPRESAAWPPEYVASGVVAPVTALSIGDARVADPVRQAVDAFVVELAKTGISVRGTPSSVVADPEAVELAVVQSRPVGTLVERMLTDSDNDYAEAFGHLVAVAGGEAPTFEGGAAATIAAVGKLQIPTTGVALYDGSGLARTDLVPAVTFAHLLAVVASPDHPELGPVQTGLPIAAFSGTLSHRFVAKPASVGAGLVRAKTGTLSGVTALAGTLQDRDGRVLAFAFLADHIASTAVLDAPAALDRAAAALSTCGCR